MKISIKSVVFVMVDIQEKFEPHIEELPQLVTNANILNRFAEFMEIPLIVTEQNPRGLGKTLDSVYLPAHHNMFEKTRFSIFEPEVENHLKSVETDKMSLLYDLAEKYRKHLVIYGIETHVCIMQTVLEAIEKGYRPIVVADAVASISPTNKQLALDRIRDEGGTVVSTEMLTFELLKGSFHPHFKDLSNLIKESKQKLKEM